jgi:GMP synthase-like glutamine amidotransferase
MAMNEVAHTMKPVAICRYAPHEGPGYFATYLSDRGVPWRLVKVDAGDPLPVVSDLGGLAMMGGPMSVNDDLPWIPPMLELVRRSVDADVPVIGHCLGGQLFSKALGGRVSKNPMKEIGWGKVDVLDAAKGAQWGPAPSFVGFHWHGETFEIPEGATRIWSSQHCANQAFVLGNSIGMQCHVEMTQDLITAWCATGAREIEHDVGRSAGVQTAEAMHQNIEVRLESLHAVADRVYSRWVSGVDRE